MRQVRQDLSALFGSMGRPGIATLMCWGCAALAYPLARRGGYAGAVAAALVCALSVFCIACVLGSGVLAFVVDAQRSCLPGSWRLARRAHLLAALSLLPALALGLAALAGTAVWPAWVPAVLMLAIALAGGLAPRRPAVAAGVLVLIVFAAFGAAQGPGGHERARAWLFAFLAAALALLPAALALTAAVEWRRVIRGGSRPREAFPHAPRLASSRRHGPGQRERPIHIVRTCLGGLFMHLARQMIIGALLLALIAAAAIGLPRLRASGLEGIVGALALTAAGLVSAAFLRQLSKLTREQLAELALLPGLGAAAAQRRALCRAVIAAPVLSLAIALLGGSAGLLFLGAPLASVGMLALCLLILWLVYAVLALQKLATFPPKRQSFIGELMLLYVWVCAIYPVYAAHAFMRLLHVFEWAWLIPVLIGLAIAAALGTSVRRLAAAPHPFLS